MRRATQHQQKRAYVDGYFYPRSPCGERQAQDGYKDTVTEFLSTLSLRRATHIRSTSHVRRGISIHALLAESDSYSQHVTWPSGYFYPRSPCGERLYSGLHFPLHAEISIHALLAESDAGGHDSPRPKNAISIHALLAESDSCAAAI